MRASARAREMAAETACQLADLLARVTVVDDDEGPVAGYMSVYPPAELATGCSCGPSEVRELS
ncbi:hypothetical protein GCM10009734_96850 [Nonomuraea bangladeshensis]